MVLPNISDERFKMMVRVNREQFHEIISRIDSNPIFNCGPNLQFPVAVQLALTLYRLGAYADGASLVRIAALFGVGDGGTVEKITKRVLNAIFNLRNECLYWPTAGEKKKLLANTLNELPNCIGYLDGTEIRLAERPCRDPDSYYSRKQQFSIKLQGVCDSQLKIRHIHVGFPGSVHDSRVFSNSSLFLNPSNFFEGEEWLAADSAYKLSSTIITPFRRNSPESEHVRAKFNKYFSKYRVRIEHCFGRLKERFCSLKELRMRLIDAKSSKYACQWITACCILHNIIIDINDDSFDTFEAEINLDDEQFAIQIDGAEQDAAGERKRKAIYALIA